MATCAQSFHQFTRLPVELRKEIWRWCLPHRVVELDYPAREIVFDLDDEDSPGPCTLFHTTRMNGRPPVISQVCSEARDVAFETGKFTTPAVKGLPPAAQWGGATSVSEGWQDLSRDSVHLNWFSGYKGQYQSYGDPLCCLAWVASHTVGPGSLTVSCLGVGLDEGDFPLYSDDSEDEDDDRPPVILPLKPEEIRDAEILKTMPECLVVVRVVVVHAPLKDVAATGFFGLLADARVRIVRLSQEAEVQALYDLAESYEHRPSVTVRQKLTREPAEWLAQRLKEAVRAKYHSEELVASMSPAIMFRLCTLMCNHDDDQ